MTKLSIKQKRFADEYIISGNAYQSAIEAGYSEAYARADSHKFLENPGIKSYIAERMAEIDKEKIASQEEVLEYLTSVMRGEVTEPLTVLDGDGYQKVIDASPSVATRNKAAELLGKRYRIFTEKQEVELTGQVIFNGEAEIED